MTVRSGIAITLVLMSLFLALGCGREKPKSNFELGKDFFRASNYKKSMILLENWLGEDPTNEMGHNAETYAILAVMYHNDETRQKSYESTINKLIGMGEPGMKAVLKLKAHPTIRSRLGSTIDEILIRGGNLSIGPVMTDLKGNNPKLQIRAKESVIKLGDVAVEPLIEALNEPDLYVRTLAIEALGEIGSKKAIDPLKEKLNDPDKLTQVMVAVALHKMGEDNPEDVILGALIDESAATRRTAAKAIWEVVDKPPLRSLLKAMKDSDPDVRNYVALSLGKIPSPDAVPTLLKALTEDPEGRVRSSAAESLEKIGKPAVDPLIKALQSSKEMGVTIRIAKILGNIGDKRAIKPLESVYNGAGNSMLRDEVAKALNMID